MYMWHCVVSNGAIMNLQIVKNKHILSPVDKAVEVI